MKRLPILLALAASLSLAFAGTAVAAPGGGAPPGQGKIQCSAGGGAICTVNTGGAKGTVTLNTLAGGAAAAYIPGYNAKLYDVRLSQVRDLSFSAVGVAGIDPHWSIPIDGANHDQVTDMWAYVSAGTCNNGTGIVDVIRDSTCTIYRSDDPLASYPNWAAFVAALGTNNWISFGDYAFVIADSSLGVWTVGNLTVGKPGK